MLAAFIPKYAAKILPATTLTSLATPSILDTLPIITGKAIDLDLAIEVVGSLELAKEMFKLLIELLPEEYAKLNAAYQNNNWLEIQAIAHKLKGSSAYCGATRLSEASKNLQNYIKTEKIELREPLYKQLLDEIDLISKESKNFITL